ncbi:unnamed protein product [Orchesella dallaii]|uniref:CUB domain-containing protein n=1 Tax=Orchesella dallaii TaxID=48710 RepID=A0ABP1RME1_9HEXA
MEINCRAIKLLILLGATFLFASPTDSASIVSDSKSPSRCGQVLTSNYGIISYKPNETYIPNERCVWIIRVENATSFDFTFSHMGYPQNDYNTKIITFEFHSLHEYWPSLGTRNIPGNVAVVTFSTSSNPNSVHQGFTMTYLAITANEPIISPASTDYISSYREAYISHPSNGALYTNNEINLIIITPDFIHVPGTTIELNFTRLELAGDNCTDRILVSAFNTDLIPSGSWSTGGDDSAQVICNDHGTIGLGTFDMMMMVFITQSEKEAAGIEFTYSSDIPILESDLI